MKYIVLILFFIAGASEAETVLYAHTSSYHVNRVANYNEINYGLGLRHNIANNRYLTIGTYRNSEYAQSNYIGYGWQFTKYLGLSAGIITGYKLGDILPYLIPTIKYKNLTLVVLPYPEAVIHLTIDFMRF